MRAYSAETSAKFDSMEMTRIGHMTGVTFYEHPTKGDEAPLIAKVKGVWYSTGHYEMPDYAEDVLELLASAQH